MQGPKVGEDMRIIIIIIIPRSTGGSQDSGKATASVCVFICYKSRYRAPFVEEGGIKYSLVEEVYTSVQVPSKIGKETARAIVSI